VIITDSKAEGPAFIAWPTCQRVAVLKKLALLREVAEEDVRRRQQLRIGPAEEPAQFPDSGEQADRQDGPTRLWSAIRG
jgi:hypothetical protein